MHPNSEPSPPPPYAGAPSGGDGTHRPSAWSGPSEQVPAAGWPPAGPGPVGGPGGPGFEARPPVASVREGRPWRVAIAAFLTMLVLLVALGNQWVTDQIDKHASTTSFAGAAARAVTTLSWRFTPPANDQGRVWLSGIIGLGIVLVLILLLVALIVRGRGGFWQAFLGTWAVVLFSVVVSVYARGFIVDRSLFSRSGDRTSLVFFGALSPNGSVIAAALGFGVVVALVAALTSAFSRRTTLVEATVPPPYAGGYDTDVSERRPEPWSQPAAVPGPVASPSPWHDESGASSGFAGPRPDDHLAGDRPADDRPADDRPADDRAQHTAVLPAVDDTPAPGHADPSHADPSHADPSHADPSHAEQSGVEQSDPSHAEQSGTNPSHAAESGAEQSSTAQSVPENAQQSEPELPSQTAHPDESATTQWPRSDYRDPPEPWRQG